MEADLDEEEYLAFVKDFIDHPRLKDAVNKSYERVHERFIFRAQFLRAKLDFTEDTQMDLPEEELPIVAMIENISEGGMFICTDLPFVKNEILKIEVSIPDGKLNHMINCKVAVKWVRKANEEQNSLPGIGLQFQGLDDISKEKIKNYISSLTNGE